ncbi:helix-turn-helix domain-containing protein [Nonomuraea pusilla]|uniref:Protein RodZ, contains Xre-like HTH and DUF4115 domains n=1 Tax=Nonomuraea pusilla TaxID=46177 RepID=A0A1H7S3C3_9ACTN|nr:helix-turn-helix domain-containing protein [Nonomuraea pusilla]SEL66779.1 protein RodZ, contains Xre-like HTH and DUF4115 domains [Nonomuraea pusilla]
MQEQSIGGMLRSAREAAGLSVAQVSAATRIREPIIHRLEQDDYEECGGDFYARGHVKAVAKAVGLDPDALVHLYDQQHGGAPQPVRAASVFQADRRVTMRERRGPNWSMALVAALAVVVVIGLVRVFGGASDQVRTADVEPVPAVPEVPRKHPAKETKRRPAAAGQAGPRQVVVRVKAKRTSYVHVRDADGRPLFAGDLKAGTVSTWRAQREVALLFGDAGAVSVQVNGKDMGKPGDRGEIIRRTYGVSAP